jgi:hypothetical protein
MRQAGVVPLAATVRPDSPLLRAIAGEAAERVAPVARVVTASAPVKPVQATGLGAAAMSAGYRGRRR